MTGSAKGKTSPTGSFHHKTASPGKVLDVNVNCEDTFGPSRVSVHQVFFFFFFFGGGMGGGGGGSL